ncbi:MAG: hypothetical protein TR69_WS6001000217 [candidate division WS6 bacterium OLB20]|uniref:Uncharacterized protein n=1 Tax=candidate division WS6 bacterium OLB20 TaxID=1617426 RepID=A0A136M0C0_9BACT|nr:MAG: hypothetical protein TR69_WS6001000217 [candidate division WS6 bacterium OLB20]
MLEFGSQEQLEIIETMERITSRVRIATGTQDYLRRIADPDEQYALGRDFKTVGACPGGIERSEEYNYMLKRTDRLAELDRHFRAMDVIMHGTRHGIPLGALMNIFIQGEGTEKDGGLRHPLFSDPVNRLTLFINGGEMETRWMERLCSVLSLHAPDGRKLPLEVDIIWEPSVQAVVSELVPQMQQLHLDYDAWTADRSQTHNAITVPSRQRLLDRLADLEAGSLPELPAAESQRAGLRATLIKVMGRLMRS